MDERRKKALEKHHQKLRTGLSIGNILPALRPMLTPAEYSNIKDRESNTARVDELIDILLTKENEHFEGFCNTLEQNGFQHWERKLRADVHQADGKLCEASLSYLAIRTRRCHRTEEKYFMVTSLLLRARKRDPVSHVLFDHYMHEVTGQYVSVIHHMQQALTVVYTERSPVIVLI